MTYWFTANHWKNINFTFSWSCKCSRTISYLLKGVNAFLLLISWSI
uniref:Uncharacterized protein n=1 Tax=Arundo donax TaxID=35708 RepID=A0A0A9BC07_ARUDO